MAECHPELPHRARGMCSTCWFRWYRAEKRRARRRPCELCGCTFDPTRSEGLYCCRLCAKVACGVAREQAEGVEFHATRERDFAAALVRGYAERGCRRVKRKASAASTQGPFVAAWHRGGGLYLIRARLPEEYREEAA